MAAYLGNYLSAPQKQKEIEFDFSNLEKKILFYDLFIY
jgi:hypothetical protein